MAAETRKIGDFTYEVFQLDPETAMDLFIDLSKNLLPALGALLGSARDVDSADLGDVLGSFGGMGAERAVEKLVAGLDKDLIKRASKVLRDVTTVQGIGGLAPIFSAHFKGGDGFKRQATWLLFAIGVQYAPLFSTSINDLEARFLARVGAKAAA